MKHGILEIQVRLYEILRQELQHEWNKNLKMTAFSIISEL